MNSSRLSAASAPPLSPLVEEAKLEETMTISRMQLGYGYTCVGMGFIFTALRLLPFLHDPIIGEPIGNFFQALTGWPRLAVEICIMATLWLVMLGSFFLLRPPDLYGNRISCFAVFGTFALGNMLGVWVGMVMGGQNGYLSFIPFIVVGLVLLVCWVVLAMRSIEVFQKRQQRAQGYAVVGSHSKGYVVMSDTSLAEH